MKDFYLTPRGDFAIENMISQNKRLEINFMTSYSNALCLNFFSEDTNEYKGKPTSFNLNFMIEIPQYNKEVKVISGNQAMEQAIKIRIASSLGSIRGNKDIGSTMESLIHELIDNKSLIPSLKACIANAIKDLIPNPVIMIEKPKTRYVNYSTNLKVIIIDKDKEYTITF